MTRRCRPLGTRRQGAPAASAALPDGPSTQTARNSEPCHTTAISADVHRQGPERQQQLTPALTGTEPGPASGPSKARIAVGRDATLHFAIAALGSGKPLIQDLVAQA